MAEAKTPTKKVERKPKVRKAPMQKDFATKLDWLKAMTEYETALLQSHEVNKIARLDKRIAAHRAKIYSLTNEVTKLEAERSALTGEVIGSTPRTLAGEVISSTPRNLVE
jgi:hypothetical protein